MRKYELAVGNCEESLKEAVNALRSKGFEYQGGVAVSAYTITRADGSFKTLHIWAQAMVYEGDA